MPEKGGLSMARKSKLILMPTCYGLDDLEAQIEAAYELDGERHHKGRIWFVFSRTTGSANEEQTARDYLPPAHLTFSGRFFRSCLIVRPIAARERPLWT